MKCVAIAAVFLFAGVAATSAQGVRGPSKPPSYPDLVNQYITGDTSGAIRALESWSEANVRSGVDRLIASRDARIKAAVVLQTDVAAGNEISTRQSGFHLNLARRLVGAAKAGATGGAAGADPFICGWYALATSILLARGDFRAAGEYVSEGVATCPSDLRVRLWQGIAADNGGVALPSATSVVGSMTDVTGYRSQRPSTPSMVSSLGRYGVNAAETAYRQALKIDAAYMDARLRLGELLDRTLQHEDALRELAAVMVDSTEPPLRYLAHLFTGRIKERAGDLPGAAVEYEAALAIGRGCQTAYLALSFVEDRLGDRAKTREIAAQFVALPDDQKFVDPWWGFRSGGGVERDLLDALRKAVRR